MAAKIPDTASDVESDDGQEAVPKLGCTDPAFIPGDAAIGGMFEIVVRALTENEDVIPRVVNMNARDRPDHENFPQAWDPMVSYHRGSERDTFK